MNKQLKPIVGALVAGLIGVAQAACYMETSYVCQEANTGTTSYYCPGGPCGCVEIIADSDWYGWNVTSTEFFTPGGDGNQNLVTPIACQGPGHAYDCNTGQNAHFPDATNGQHYSRIGTDPNYACTQQP